MIEIKNLYKKFKNTIIFEDANVVFNNGKKILIKAPNGTGKSVLLKLIVGYSTPNKGDVIIDDYTLKQDSDFIKNAGVSINAPEFNKHLSGMDNLLLLANIRKKTTKEYINSIVEYLEMKDMIHKKI
ncbi:MAG: ATP-binding cassette domain-containing protein [Methanobrevibacter sp.]|jgi:ABC-2 type transport system ATP-binding protein|nr:ATP-binding cassette domain-containing protein [Candidatus Methanovirga australis]